MHNKTTPLPLFVCHANCCRSVLAKYLYEHLFEDSRALSAGIAVGEVINDRACAMLAYWGIDAAGHTPRRIDRALCDRADAIFLMGPEYLRILLARYGMDLAMKSYLFADPFSVPRSFENNEYLVRDPSFEQRPIPELADEFSWFRTMIGLIHESLVGGSGHLVAANQYLEILTKP